MLFERSRTGPRAGQARHAPARWWSTPAIPTPSPAIAGARRSRQIMAQVARHLGCEPSEVFVSSTGVIGVPLPKDKAQAGRRRGARSACVLVGRSRRNHRNDRHFHQGRAGDGGGRRYHGDDRRDHQGQRHDRARHGDDARLRVHRRGGRSGFLQRVPVERQRRAPSAASPSTATPRPATPCWPSPPARPATPPLASFDDAGRRRFRRRAARRLPPARPPGGARRRRGAEIHRDCRQRRG